VSSFRTGDAHSATRTQGIKQCVESQCVELIFIDGRTIVCTEDHRFLFPRTRSTPSRTLS
jgi:hypothetical protein